MLSPFVTISLDSEGARASKDGRANPERGAAQPEGHPPPEPSSGFRGAGRGAAAQPRSGTFFSIKMGHRSRPYGTHCKRCFIFLTLWSCKTRLSSTRGQSGPVEGVSTRWRARRLRLKVVRGAGWSRAARGTTERSSGPCCAHCLVARTGFGKTSLAACASRGQPRP